MTHDLLDIIWSTPHPIGVLRVGGREPAAVPSRPTEVSPKEQERPQPICMKITRGMVEEFGCSAGCSKCRAIASRDPGYGAVGHCKVPRTHRGPREDVNGCLEVAPECRIRFVAEYIEKHGRTSLGRLWVRLDLSLPAPVCPARARLRDTRGMSVRVRLNLRRADPVCPVRARLRDRAAKVPR